MPGAVTCRDAGGPQEGDEQAGLIGTVSGLAPERAPRAAQTAGVALKIKPADEFEEGGGRLSQPGGLFDDVGIGAVGVEGAGEPITHGGGPERGGGRHGLLRLTVERAPGRRSRIQFGDIRNAARPLQLDDEGGAAQRWDVIQQEDVDPLVHRGRQGAAHEGRHRRLVGHHELPHRVGIAQRVEGVEGRQRSGERHPRRDLGRLGRRQVVVDGVGDSQPCAIAVARLRPRDGEGGAWGAGDGSRLGFWCGSHWRCQHRLGRIGSEGKGLPEQPEHNDPGNGFGEGFSSHDVLLELRIFII